MDWSGVHYLWIIVMFFISCLDSHSDGTHSLQRIHWWASDGMLHFFKSVPMQKQTHWHLEWPEGEYIFNKCSFLGELFLLMGLSFFSKTQHIYPAYLNITFPLVVHCTGHSLTLLSITHLPLRTVCIYSDKGAVRILLVLLPCDFSRLGLVNACQGDL